MAAPPPQPARAVGPRAAAPLRGRPAREDSDRGRPIKDKSRAWTTPPPVCGAGEHAPSAGRAALVEARASWAHAATPLRATPGTAAPLEFALLHPQAPRVRARPPWLRNARSPPLPWSRQGASLGAKPAATKARTPTHSHPQQWEQGPHPGKRGVQCGLSACWGGKCAIAGTACRAAAANHRRPAAARARAMARPSRTASAQFGLGLEPLSA